MDVIRGPGQGTPALVSGPTALLPSGDTTAQAVALRVGARVEALIVDLLGNGRALLEIEGGLFQARLPDGVAAGAGRRLALEVLETGTVPRFALADEPAATPAARVDIGSLASRLRDIALAAQAASTVDIAPEPPLLPAPPAAGRALEQPLREALQGSGMFYESHQAEWVGGRRELASLRAEPQARLAAASPAITSPVVPRDSAVTEAQPSSQTRGDAAAATASLSGTSQEGGAQPVSPALASIVDRQLQALGNHAVQWSGMLWPGQKLEWVVEEQGREEGGGREDDTPRWASRLRLQLPVVGEVEAALSLTGQALRLTLRVPEGSRSAFEQALPELRASLEARGLLLQEARVAGDGA
jgi:hypothetical protein